MGWATSYFNINYGPPQTVYNIHSFCSQGMVDPGEPLTVTLIREFGEEACNTLEVSPEKKIDIMHKLSQLFSKGTAVSTFVYTGQNKSIILPF